MSFLKIKFKEIGFTIVELLVVIVVIGILASISIVSYTQISKKAAVSSIYSDIDGATKKIKLFQAEYGYLPTTISSDCTTSSTTDTNLCLENNDGNIYSFYKADNNPIAQTFTLISTNGNDSYYINGNGAVKQFSNTTIRTSCLDIYNNSEANGDGYYKIHPVDTDITVFCDMSNGGWTRLNNNIATSTTAFDINDIISTPNIPGNCGAPGCAFTISSILVDHTKVKTINTRTTSISQCPILEGVISASNTYFNGSGWVSNGTCLWNDKVFSNSTSTDMTGLKQIWKIEANKAINGNIKYTSKCSGSEDNGLLKITAWVK